MQNAPLSPEKLNKIGRPCKETVSKICNRREHLSRKFAVDFNFNGNYIEGAEN